MFVTGLIIGLVVGLVGGFVGEILLAKAVSGMTWSELSNVGELMLDASDNRECTITLEKDGETIGVVTLEEV